MGLVLTVLPDTLTICRLEPDAAPPTWAMDANFWSITRTADELSVVVPAECVPTGIRAEGAWRALQIAGPIPLSAVGILASVAEPLARAGINLFAVSTFDTDYVLVAADRLKDAWPALSAAGHTICG